MAFKNKNFYLVKATNPSSNVLFQKPFHEFIKTTGLKHKKWVEVTQANVLV